MREILGREPQGIRYSVLAKMLIEALPDIRPNTIHGTISNAQVRRQNDFYKPAKGLFRLAKFREESAADTALAPMKLKEEHFYSSFADYLTRGLEECSKAIVLGGNKFRDKWGTPDVVGVLKPRPTDIFTFPTEIVSAEIKIDVAGLITAFGQACAYKLFSHKSYIVVPESSSPTDISRLDSLCIIFGIGLIVFDASSPTEPNFTIRARAARHEPDMFYVNLHIREIAEELLS